MSFKNGFFAGLFLAGIIATWLFQLWQPERQVALHSENLLLALQAKSWTSIEAAVAADYEDDWGHDRALALSRLRQVLSYSRNVRLQVSDAVVRQVGEQRYWRARIRFEADSDEVTDLVRARVNAVEEPFELHWRQQSWKPWDWKLIRVSNPALEVPSY